MPSGSVAFTVSLAKYATVSSFLICPKAGFPAPPCAFVNRSSPVLASWKPGKNFHLLRGYFLLDDVPYQCTSQSSSRSSRISATLIAPPNYTTTMLPMLGSAMVSVGFCGTWLYAASCFNARFFVFGSFSASVGSSSSSSPSVSPSSTGSVG